MSTTDELLKLLDERGVEYRWDNGTATWYVNGVMYNAWGYDTERLTMSVCHLTPAQAIEATLGRGECHNTSKVTDKHGQARFACSACGAWLDSRLLWNPEYMNGESPFVLDCKLNFCPNCGRRIVEVDE